MVVQTQIPQASSRQGASTGRRSKLVKSNARMVYVEMEDPLLKSLQQRLVSCGEGTLTSPSKPEKSDLNSPASSSRCASILQKVDFLQLLSNVSEKTSCLRMNVKGLDAVRFDRAVTRALAALLLIGAVRVRFLFSNGLREDGGEH